MNNSCTRIEPNLLSEMRLDAIARHSKVFELRVVTGSMEPLIKTGDHIVVKFIDKPGLLRIGDIAVFNFDGNLIVHRIINKFKEEGELYFRQKGDAGIIAVPARADSIVGRVVAIKDERRTVQFESFKWVAINRTAGTMFMLIDLAYRKGKSLEAGKYFIRSFAIGRIFKKIYLWILRRANNTIANRVGQG